MKTGFRLGSLAQDAVTGIKIIFATPANAQFMTLETPVGIDYQVPAGKTFYITQAYTEIGGANGSFLVGYGDDGVPSQAGAPTNWKQMTTLLYIDKANVSYPFNLFVPIPAGKYPTLLASGGVGHINIVGVEL